MHINTLLLLKKKNQQGKKILVDNVITFSFAVPDNVPKNNTSYTIEYNNRSYAQ